MRLARIRVTNFRNLASIDVPVQPGTVIVGENRSGKSNLIHALRLVLDPSLPNSERYLRREDFWDGLAEEEPAWDPFEDGDVIEIAVEFTDFEDDPAAFTALADALIEGVPMRAEIGYRYAPGPAPEGSSEPPPYEWRIYGGGDPTRLVANDLRGYLFVAYLQALRDAAGDLKSWSRSPLRPLLEEVAAAASAEELEAAAEAIADANARVTDLDPVKALAARITARTVEVVGDEHALEAELGVAPLDPGRLLRSLQIFVDGEARRPVARASLGTLNVLYLTLLELALEQRVAKAQLAHVVYAIEEPEAHLHVHLQRLIFRRVLRTEDPSRSALVTTHSPHIASVANARGLVVLRSVGRETKARASIEADLGDEEWSDIERYLDATRAEFVFARRVLLVEGYAEQVLIPALAASRKIDLDKVGLSVCGVHGTHFGAYARFLEALGIPWAIVTDGDPDDDGDRLGVTRAQRILKRLGKEGDPSSSGIFVGEDTLEYDLYRASPGNANAVRDALRDLGGSKSKKTVGSWEATPPDCDDLMAIVRRVGGKGRVAQRLSTSHLDAPGYIDDAFAYLLAT